MTKKAFPRPDPDKPIRLDVYRNITDADFRDRTIPPGVLVWLYSRDYPQNVLQCDKRWCYLLAEHGFQPLTPLKISRKYRQLLTKQKMSRTAFATAVNAHLINNRIDEYFSKKRHRYLDEGDDRADITPTMLKAFAAIFGVQTKKLYATNRASTALGLFRTTAIFPHETFSSVYLAVSADAAKQTLMCEMIFGGERLDKSPVQWEDAAIDCALLASWTSAVELEEILGWVGRTSTKPVSLPKSTLRYPKEENS